MIDTDIDESYGNITYPRAELAETSLNLRKLGRSAHTCYKNWECFRKQNRSFVEAYLGPGYGSTKDKRPKYVNKSYQAAIVNVMQLAARLPKVDIDSEHRELAPFAKVFESAMNHLLGEIRFADVLRRWVLDAYFQIGIVKVHRKDSGYVELEPSLWVDPGLPAASNVSLDDFVCDVSARNWGEVKWAGDMYRVPLRSIKEGVKTGIYDKKALECCKPSSKNGHALDADRLEKIGKGEECDDDEFEPMVDLADIWVAADQRIYTFPVTQRSNFDIYPEFIASMEWYDPDQSPYHILGFYEAPENVMPVAPAAVMDELDRALNNIYRKQVRRSKNQKQVHICRNAQADTAKRVRDANDDEFISGEPESINTVQVGGINPLAQSFASELERLADEMGGNIKARMGSGPQAETASQEELIHAAGNAIVGKMQQSVLEATSRLVRSLGLELWRDEFKTIVSNMPVEGATGYTFDATWSPDERMGNFLDYNFSINIFSSVWMAPQAQLETLKADLMNFYMPMAQAIEAQGGVFNYQLICDKVAEMSGQPWRKDLIVFQGVPEEGEKPTADIKSGMKPNGPRTSIRKSVSTGGSPQGQQQARSMAWLGAASPQQANIAGLGGMQ
jgi:hypothetical protein